MKCKAKMKSAWFYLLFLNHFYNFFPGSNGAIDDGDYLITIPRVFRAGTKQNVGVNIFGNKSCDVTLKLYDSARSGNKIQVQGRFGPNEAGVLEIQIPKGLSRAKVIATVCGRKTPEKTVTYEVPTKNVFIQTDKPIYKPGQKVLIRIISVNSELKPWGKIVSSVVIQEPAGVKIMKWNDVVLQDGFANLDLQLSNEPVLGKWLIKANVEGLIVTKRIEIRKYDLPKFQVDVKPPSYFAFDQKEIPISICASNAYGMSVSGRLETTLCLMHFGNERNCLTEIKNVSGCLQLSGNELLNSITEYQFDSKFYINIQATFTEAFTGIKVKETARSPNLVRKSQSMSFVNVPSKFKPGFPLTFKVQINYLDGKPVTDGRIHVEVSGRHFDETRFKKFILSETYLVKNGLLEIVLPNIPINTKTIIFKAIFNSGHLEIKKVSKAWYSPSLSYLKLVIPHPQSAKVGSEGSLQILYTSRVHPKTEKEPVFQYKILCKGNIVLSGVTIDRNISMSRLPSISYERTFRYNGKKIRRTNIHQFEFRFNVTQRMVPSCRILVYYVKMDKETVGDSIVFNVEEKLENQFSIDFVQGRKRPGEKTKIVIKAEPGSHVAISALDKSVLLLRDLEDVTKKKVIGILNRQDVGPIDATRYSTCSSSKTMPLATDVSETFNNAGVLFLSNLNIFTQSCRKPPTSRPIRVEYPYPRWRGWLRLCRLPWFYRSKKTGNNSIGDHSGQKDTAFNLASTFTTGKRPRKNLKMETVRVRRYFPETWLWTDFKFNDTSGIQTMEVDIPDTAITSWVAKGFAMSPMHGMGISHEAVLKAFQPFFVQMTLPYSVVRGEELPVQVTVFNYLSSCVPVKLELFLASKDFAVTSFHISKLCVCRDDAKSAKFNIIPKRAGYIPLTVRATTSAARLCPKSTVFAADAVTRQLLVEPEGIKQEYTKGTFFCVPKTGKHNEAIDLALPRETIPGSVHPVISIVGDIIGPALTNLDGLLEMPFGCGEQNMAKLAPNIFIMDYLTNTNQVTKEIRDEAIKYMRTGYQTQLTKKRRRGSYSAWGNSDEQGSMMLTAFVVRSFARARKYIFVDQDEIKHSIEWFQNKQKPSGCFPQYGTVLMKSIQGGINSELTTTAYVVIALLESGFNNETTMVSQALECLTKNLDRIQDSYATSLVTYTLVLADHPMAGIMMTRLRNKAITSKDGGIFWSADNDEKITTTDYFTNRPRPVDIEMTGYALMSFLRNTELVNDVTKIVKWLSKHRNGIGGFSSTQDTCVALQALSEAAQKYYTDDVMTNLTVSTIMKDISIQDFTITGRNKVVLQRAEIPRDLLPNSLAVNASGVGCALLQATVKYNIPVTEDVPAFEVSVSVHRRETTDEEENTVCYPLQLKIYAKWLKEEVSNMAIVDVKLVSGFTVNERALQEKLKESEYVVDSLVKQKDEAILKRYEINGQNVILYFDEIAEVNFTLDILQSALVKKLKPGVVKVYDYYEPENQAQVMYIITDEDCYGERIETECPKCLSVVDFQALFDKGINCTTYLRRVKSLNGILNVKKGYIKAKNIEYSAFPYTIPAFCPCDEIYSGVTSLVFGQSDNLQRNGVDSSFVLNPGTTIARWNGKTMRRMFQEKMAQEIYRKCWRFFSG